MAAPGIQNRACRFHNKRRKETASHCPNGGQFAGGETHGGAESEGGDCPGACKCSPLVFGFWLHANTLQKRFPPIQHQRWPGVSFPCDGIPYKSRNSCGKCLVVWLVFVRPFFTLFALFEEFGVEGSNSDYRPRTESKSSRALNVDKCALISPPPPC